MWQGKYQMGFVPLKVKLSITSAQLTEKTKGYSKKCACVLNGDAPVSSG